MSKYLKDFIIMKESNVKRIEFKQFVMTYFLNILVYIQVDRATFYNTNNIKFYDFKNEKRFELHLFQNNTALGLINIKYSDDKQSNQDFIDCMSDLEEVVYIEK